MLLLEAAGAQHTLVNSQEQNPAPTPTHAWFALKSCAWSSPHLVSMTNAHRELGAQLLPGPSTFQLFHNLGNVQRNQSEILRPFTPRGLTFNRIYITNTRLFWGEGSSSVWAILIPDAPPQEAPTNLAKLWSLRRGGSIEVSFLTLSPNAIIPTGKAAQQGSPALQTCLQQRKSVASNQPQTLPFRESLYP